VIQVDDNQNNSDGSIVFATVFVVAIAALVALMAVFWKLGMAQ